MSNSEKRRIDSIVRKQGMVIDECQLSVDSVYLDLLIENLDMAWYDRTRTVAGSADSTR